MNKTRLVFSAIAIVLLSTLGLNAQNTVAPSDTFTKIEAYLSAGVANGFSGAMLVSSKGQVLLNKGYGIANKDINTLNNPNTIFDIGSNTKQFTATAVLKLAEQGKLKVTDSLQAYFKELPADKRHITIHQLLTHSAGFVESIGRDFDEITEQDFFEQLFASELLFESGSAYSYSNVGYSILGKIIEMTSGQAYEAFLNTHLFTPAGMKQTGYLLPKWDTIQLARSYNRGVLDGPSTVRRYQETGDLTWHLKANGGINATQNDMLLWYKALKANKIITAQSLKNMMIPHALAPSGTYSYGYGWGVRESKGHGPRIAHNGSNGAFAHSLIWYPQQDLYIVFATNSNSSKVEGLARVVEKMILDPTYEPKPLQNNIYFFTINYAAQNPTEKSKDLLLLLQQEYTDEFTNSGILNTVGNFLLGNSENLPWALEFFKMNVNLYPDDGNLWDSLGEAYSIIKDNDNAIECFEKALELKPEINCYWCENSTNRLQELSDK